MLGIFLQSLVVGGGLFWLGVKMVGNRFKRWGGVILILSFLILVLFHRELEITRQLQGVFWGSVAILLFGLWDDWRNLSWKTQLLFQGFLVALLIFFGFQIDVFRGLNEVVFRLDGIMWQGVSVLSVVFVFFWVTSIINAVNWLDGVDSSMGAVALVGGLSILAVSFFPEVNQPAVGILASIFLGVMVAFLFFNFPPAKVEAGTSGSYFVGFILATLAIIAGSKIITLMIVLLLPLLDFGRVIFLRYKSGESIFKKDKRHLHYQLRDKGWQDWQIFLAYFVFLGGVLVIYLLLPTREMRFGLLLVEAVLLWIVLDFYV